MMKSEQIEQGTFASQLLQSIGQRISQPIGPLKQVNSSQIRQNVHTEIPVILTTQGGAYDEDPGSSARLREMLDECRTLNTDNDEDIKININSQLFSYQRKVDLE